MIKQKCDQAKMKRPKIFFSPTFSCLSFDLLGSGVPTSAWLRCNVGISLDLFYHVYKLSSFPVNQNKTVL